MIVPVCVPGMLGYGFADCRVSKIEIVPYVTVTEVSLAFPEVSVALA